MEYMLIYKEPQSTFDLRNNPTEAPAYWGAWGAYIGAMVGAGVTRGGNALQDPHTATMVTVKDGQRQVQDGPYADTREHLGGYMILDVPSLDEALEWAAKAPCCATGGNCEIRPVLPAPGKAKD